jgi:chromosome partitioning protein
VGKTIVIANPKGGCGKTTTAVNLAVALCRDQYRVLIIDADRQGSVQRWVSVAPDGEELPFEVMGLTEPILHKEIPKKIQDYDFIVVDCPPEKEDIPRSAVAAADLVIIPVTPSPLDAWAAAGLGKLLHDLESLRPELKKRILINKLVVGTILSIQVPEALETFNIPLMDTRIHQRQVYAKAPLQGRSVFDFHGEAAGEVESLKEEILYVFKEGR